MNTERVAFTGSRGLKLVGELWPGGRCGVVLCHGFTGDRHENGRFDRLAATLSGDGFAVLAFDFAGSGESDDTPLTVAGEVEDMKAALRFVRSRGVEHVAIVGLSLGALVAARAAADEKDKIGALVFWAPVTTAMADPAAIYSREQLDELERTGRITWGKDDGPRRHIVIEGSHLAERRAVDQRALLAGIRVPVLILHGSRDDVVPLPDSRNAIRLLPRGSRLKVIRGADHVFHEQLPRFIDRTRRWLTEWEGGI